MTFKDKPDKLSGIFSIRNNLHLKVYLVSESKVNLFLTNKPLNLQKLLTINNFQSIFNETETKSKLGFSLVEYKEI